MSGFAYLSQGKLHLQLDDSPMRVIESKFGMSVRQRAREIHQRNSWKTEGRGAKFMRGGGGFLWGMNDFDPGSMQINISGLSRGCGDGELVYSLQTPEVTGVFVLQDDAQQEQRLWHTADHRVSQVCGSPDQQRIACVLVNKNGTSIIGQMRADGAELSEVTGGDAIDMSPRWVPGTNGTLVFQSAGIARDQQGLMRGRAPFSIQRLSIEDGSLECLVEDETHDLLGPQQAADGTLYFIRRPYEGVFGKVKWTRAALDFVLFPFRLLYAIFQFLNFFTMRYAGKTLATASGAAQREADLKRMMVWGNVIDASKVEDRSGDTPALVPKSWELVKRAPDGSEIVLAQNVLSFDLCGDGSVLYSNGTGVYRLSDNGKSERLAKDSMVEQVVAL